MGYYPLGPRTVAAGPDSTEQNPGNYTAVLDSTVLRITTPVFELYHLFIKAPGISSNIEVTLGLNLSSWDVTLTGQANGWDPAQPMLCIPGDVIYIFFGLSYPQAQAPQVVGWFRYQP